MSTSQPRSASGSTPPPCYQPRETVPDAVRFEVNRLAMAALAVPTADRSDEHRQALRLLARLQAADAIQLLDRMRVTLRAGGLPDEAAATNLLGLELCKVAMMMTTPAGGGR